MTRGVLMFDVKFFGYNNLEYTGKTPKDGSNPLVKTHNKCWGWGTHNNICVSFWGKMGGSYLQFKQINKHNASSMQTAKLRSGYVDLSEKEWREKFPNWDEVVTLYYTMALMSDKIKM